MTSVLAPIEPTILEPEDGATLGGAIEVFTWDLGGIPIDRAMLFVGSNRGGSQYGRKQVDTDTTASMGGLPTDGSPVFLRIWYRTSGQWRFLDRDYVAATDDGLPVFTSPSPGGRLNGATHTFAWSFGSLPVSAGWLYVGTGEGRFDVGAFRLGDGPVATSLSVPGLPTDEQTVHARLYFLVADAWYFVDETFVAAIDQPPSKDELTRELQTLVGTTADGIVGPQTRAALNRNWLGNRDSFDPSFAERFTNDPELVRWVQQRINTRARLDLALTGAMDDVTEGAVVSHLDRGGVVAAESYLTLLDP